MLLDIVLLCIGFVLLIKGADIFVEGSSKVAVKLHIPEIVIGLTIVAFGTSAPEAAISITSALNGSSDLSIGNIIGSNIMNVLLILGITGCICRLKVKETTYRYEIPFVMIITLLLLLLGKINGSINFFDGIILWIFFLLFLSYLLYLSKSGDDSAIEDVETLTDKDTGLHLFLLIIFGMAGIVIGSNLTIEGASGIASALGVSERMIGLTIVAFGTSLPELITSVTAGLKGKADLSVGNIIGSNIFNILFVLGTTALVSPHAIAFSSKFIIDGIIAIVAMILFFCCITKKREVSRIGAMIMLISYVAYFIFLIQG